MVVENMQDEQGCCLAGYRPFYKLFLTNNCEISRPNIPTVSENGWNLYLQYGWKNS